MILVDSSVIIDFFKTQDPRMLQLMIQHQAAVCGIVRAECLTGEKKPHNRRAIVTALDTFTQLSFPESLWDSVGLQRTILQAGGVTLPFNDVAIATLALHYDIELWTRDKQFQLMQNVLTKLKLFQEPP